MTSENLEARIKVYTEQPIINLSDFDVCAVHRQIPAAACLGKKKKHESLWTATHTTWPAGLSSTNRNSGGVSAHCRHMAAYTKNNNNNTVKG